MALYDRIVSPELLIRRVNLTANRLTDESTVQPKQAVEQLDLFSDYAALDAQRQAEAEALAEERKLQLAMLEIKSNSEKRHSIGYEFGRRRDNHFPQPSNWWA